MTTKTYNTVDELPDLSGGKQITSVDELPDLKKKESSPASVIGGEKPTVGTGIIPPSTSQSVSEPSAPIESPFEFGKYRDKKIPMAADLPKVLNQVKAKVFYGDIKPEDISNLYAKDRETAKRLVRQYAPEVAEEQIESGTAIDIASKNINEKNRINFVNAEELGVGFLDEGINNSISALNLPTTGKAGSLTGYINELRSELSADGNYSNNDKLSGLISKVKKLQDVEQRYYLGDEERNKSKEATTQLLVGLNDRLNYNISKQGVTPTLNSFDKEIEQAIVGKILQSELGINQDQVDVTKDNEKINHFKLGMTAVEKTDPVLFKNVLNGIASLKKIDDTDFTTISKIGQEISNTMRFRGGAYDPELIGTESNFDYSTFGQKVADASVRIGEWAKSKGYKNMNKFPEKIIRQGAKESGVDNPEVVKALVSNEDLLFYDAIPKSGWVDDVASGVMQPLVGINSTLNSWTESPAETYLRSKSLSGNIGGQKVVDAKGEISDILPSERDKFTTDMFRGLGQFIPQVLLTKGVGTGVKGIVGLTGVPLSVSQARNVADFGGTAISTFLQSYGPAYEEHLQKTGDSDTAALIGTIDGISSSAFELLLPDVRIADKAFAGLKQGLATDLMGLIKKGGDPADLMQKARPFVQKFFTNATGTLVQENLEELGTQYVDFVTESIFDPTSAKDRNLNKELWDTFKATSAAMILPSVLGAGGSAAQKDFTVKTLHSSAINFDSYKESLQKTLDNGYIDQNEFNNAVKLISTHKQSVEQAPELNINGVPIDKQKQLDYAYEDTKIKVYKEKAEASSGVANEMWESKIKQSEDVQREIVMPKEVAAVVSATEDIIVDESPNLLSPQETIIKAVTDEVITGVEADLIKQGTATPDDILLSFAKQKYGVAEDGSVFPEGGRDISMKTSLDVDEAVEKTFPTQQSVIDAIKKPVQESQSAIQTEGTANVVPLVQSQIPVVDLGTRVQTTEPPATEGVTPVTLSGLTEQERQAKIERRVKETTVTDTQKQTNDLLKKVKSYNSLPNGRLGKLRPAGLQQLNNIRLEAQKLGLTFDERARQLKTSGNRSVRTDNREVGDRAIAPNAVVLRDRPQQTQDVFNQLNESGQFPNGYRLDNKQMSVAEIDGAIQDIVDGLPSERANNYLNQLEKYIADDRFEIGNPGEIKLSPSLNDLLGVQPETQSQPMTPEALEAWLNDESTLTPEQEQIVTDNIENLIQDYEPQATTESVVQSTEPEAEITNTTTTEQNTEPINTPTPTPQTAKTTTAKPTVKSLTDELRALLGNEALGLKGDANPKNRMSFKDLGIDENDTAETLIDKLIAHGGQFTDILKAIKSDANFKNVQLEIVNSTRGLENGESGLYYPVGYGEGKDNLLQLSNKDNVYYTATHELVHFLTLDSAVANEVKNTESYKGLEDMYNYIADKKGKPVAIAGGATVENYGLSNVKEFMAELLINPSFRAYVGDVFATNKEDIFKSSKALRDSKVNSIADIVYNFFVDLFKKLFNKNDGGVPFNDKFSVIQNAAKNSVDLFLGGQDVISIQGQPQQGEGATVLEMGDQNSRAAALALPSTGRDAQINTFVKSALDRGVNEADLKQALINNGISDADAQAFIDSNKSAPAPQPKPATAQRSDNEIISTVLNQRLDAKTFPTLFAGNEEKQQIAANTQGVGQNREVDGAYIAATEKDLKEISVQVAKLLRDELGKDWGTKTLAWIEQNPSQGNIAQVVGVLNVISSENFQEIQDTHDGNRVNKLAAIQKRIDVVSIQRARDASLGLVQRRLYAQFAQGESITNVVANSILSPELQQLQTDLNEIVSSQPTDNEINSAPPAKTTTKKRTTIRNVTGAAKRRSSVKDDLINKGAEVAGSTKKSFKELIEDAKNKLNNVKC